MDADEYALLVEFVLVLAGQLSGVAGEEVGRVPLLEAALVAPLQAGTQRGHVGLRIIGRGSRGGGGPRRGSALHRRTEEADEPATLRAADGASCGAQEAGNASRTRVSRRLARQAVAEMVRGASYCRPAGGDDQRAAGTAE